MRNSTRDQTMIPLTQRQIEELLDCSSGMNAFLQALEKSSSENIALILMKYISFNKYFGAGVAYLSSQLAIAPNMFLDSQEPSIASDRSMDVASHVFKAGVDEFGDTSLPNRPTHRLLAQATQKAVFEYFHYSPGHTATLIKSLDPSVSAIVLRGYGQGYTCEEDLLNAMGFHIGSEFLASREFRILDRYLRKNYAGLVEHLEHKDILISGNPVPAYYWINIHTSVEQDHFLHAVRAANIAQQYYAGTKSKTAVRKIILDGVSDFGDLQETFMRSLLSK